MDIRGSLKYRVASRMPLPAYRYIYRREVIGVFYHVVTDEQLPYVQHLYAYKTKAMFERDLDYLKENYSLISYSQLIADLSGGRLKPGSLSISFDDGYKECFTVARPLLLKLDIPCIFFITTDFIDNQKIFYRNKVAWCVDAISSLSESRLKQFFQDVQAISGEEFYENEAVKQWLRELSYTDEALIDGIAETLNIKWTDLIKNNQPYMSSDEIKELASDGFVIGAHSCKHIMFNQLNAAQIEEEIVDSSQIIKELTGQQEVPFSFPFSGAGVDWQLISDLRSKVDYLGLFFDSRGLVEGPPYLINRVWADPPAGSTDFESNLDNLILETYRENFLTRF